MYVSPCSNPSVVIIALYLKLTLLYILILFFIRRIDSKKVVDSGWSKCTGLPFDWTACPVLFTLQLDRHEFPLNQVFTEG
jgi:hypothetical protein